MMTDPAASRPGTHLDPDRMADLVEGLLDPAAADAARTHLASCLLCAGDFALIAGHPDPADGALTALAELLPPVPIPRDVAVRVEAALHREPPLATAAALATHAAARPRRRFRLALGGLAGATLAVVAGVGILVANSGSQSYKSSSTAAGGASTSQHDDAARTAGQSPNGMSPALGAAGSPSGAGSYGSLSIEKQAASLLGQRVESPAAGTVQPGKTTCTPDTVAAGTRLLASTQTQYQGKQAWLLVYAQPGSSTVADVYVVDVAACTSGHTGQYAYRTTISRP